MRQAGPGLAALVDEGVQVAGNRGGAPLPRFGDQLRFVILELGEGAHVPTAVHDDFLVFERRVKIGDDPNAPVALFREDERLRRRHVLVAGAEGAGLELLGGGLLERGLRRPGTLGAAGSDHGDAARLGFAAKLAAQLAPSAFGTKSRIRSTGKTIVVACDEPSSSSVCR